MKSKLHPYIPELQDLHRQGRISRRDFVRMAALLGVSSAGMTALLAGCTPKTEPAATAVPAAATAVPAVATALPQATTAAAVKRGGELRFQTNIYKLTDPAQNVIVEYNVWWFVCEYLAVVDEDNLTHPWLLEKWEATEDLKTWTLSCRKGIKFNHGPEFTADDVVFNIKRWLDPNTQCSMLGLMGSYLSPNDVEKVDDYTVKLHLSTPQVAVPEHLFHSPAGIVSKDFEGDWLKQPVGTGPFTLSEYAVDERAVVKARKDYWRKGVDGSPLPYLDSIRMVYLGSDPAPTVAAMQSGELDATLLTSPMLKALEGSDKVTIASQVSSFCYLARMRYDKEPFTDARVRKALKICQDRAKIVEALQGSYGAQGEDHHVAPIHPEYTSRGPVAQDYEKAKALLKEAGYENGLTVTLTAMDTEPVPTFAQLIKDQCAPAGINVEINTVPESMYWDQWTDVDFGITSWAHRPLAIMTLGLAYRTDAPWNESHYANPEFDALLTEAEGTLDIEKRKEVVGKIEDIMQEDGTVMIPCWNALLLAHGKRVQHLRAAPHDHLMAYETWLDDQAA